MNRTVILGLIGAFIVVAALLLNHFLTVDPSQDVATDTQESTVATGSEQTVGDTASTQEATSAAQSAAEVSVESGDTSASDTAATASDTSDGGQESGAATDNSGTVSEETEDAGPHVSETGVASADSGGEVATQPQSAPPSFDVVRISREGDTVIAGRAAPGAEIIVMDGDTEIGRTNADDRGEWVYLPDAPLAPGSHNLSLVTRDADGNELSSEDSVVLVVPEVGKDVAGEETEEPTEALAVLVPKSPEKLGSKVLQKPSGEGVASDTGSLVVDSVDYDDSGKVSIGGRGKPGTSVQAYLDDKAVGRVEVSPEGDWQVTPDDDVEEGVYTLRVDEVESGEVTARLELPFSKARPILDFAGDSFIIVQPGNSLWRIARRTLGSGYSYSVIYEANRDQIRDPDLIYPGQIFEVPAN